MQVNSRPFGVTKYGEAVTAYELVNASGVSAVILDYGATVQSLLVPDRGGKLTDVVLGYETVAEYEQNGGYMGATLGRVANRIGGARSSPPTARRTSPATSASASASRSRTATRSRYATTRTPTPSRPSASRTTATSTSAATRSGTSSR